MNKNKKIIALLLTISALNSGVLPNVSEVFYGIGNNIAAAEYRQVFADVPSSHWAYSYIGEMYKRGVVNGYSDGNFYPSATVTRAEFAKMMTTAASINADSYGTTTGYSDVPQTHWAASYVAAAKEYLSDYINADGTRSFRPNTAAVREDIAVAMVKLKGIDTDDTDESVLKTMFSDYSSISANARKYIAAAIENGIVSGYEDGTFRAQATITRAEAVAMMWRAFQTGSDSKQWKDDTSAENRKTTPAPTKAASKKTSKSDDDDESKATKKPSKSDDESKPAKKPSKSDDDDDNKSENKKKDHKDDEKSEKPAEKEEKDPEENNSGEVYCIDTLDDMYRQSAGKTLYDDYLTFSSSSNTVYWYNSSENVIKSMSCDSRKVKTYLDLNDVKLYEYSETQAFVVVGDSDEDDIEDIPYYDDIKVQRIFYDDYSEQLIIGVVLNGYTDPNELEKVNRNLGAVLVSSESGEIDLSEDKIISNLFEHIYCSTERGFYMVGPDSILFVNRKNGKETYYSYHNMPTYYFSSLFVNNGELYMISDSGIGSKNTMYKKSTSDNSWEKVQEIGRGLGVAVNSNNAYILDADRDALIKCSPKGKLSNEADLSNLKVVDGTGTAIGDDYLAEDRTFVVSNNGDIIFYNSNKDSRSLRIVYKD